MFCLTFRNCSVSLELWRRQLSTTMLLVGHLAQRKSFFNGEMTHSVPWNSIMGSHLMVKYFNFLFIESSQHHWLARHHQAASSAIERAWLLLRFNLKHTSKAALLQMLLGVLFSPSARCQKHGLGFILESSCSDCHRAISIFFW